jgi:hypothetical protein
MPSRRTAAILLALLATGCGHAAQSVAPSALAASPSTYDGQDVSVSGTAKDPTARQMRRGTATVYQLCDNSCITVLQFGTANVSDGAQTSVTGRFHAAFGRLFRMTNVLVVGGRAR